MCYGCLIRGQILNMFKNCQGCTSTTTYDYGCNTESYGPVQIATNDAGLYPWLIRRSIRECVTWALASFEIKAKKLLFGL